MVKNIRHTENQKLFFDEDISSSPNSSKLKDIHSANLTFRKRTEIYSKVPTVEINDAIRTVLCDSKVKIGKYDISKHQHIYQIRIYFPIDDGLLRLILTKCASIIGLKYKCDNCILEVEGNEKTICFHY